MSALENTISMMRVLPETDQLKIQDFTKKLFQHYEDETASEAVGRLLRPMSREDIYKDLEISRKQAAEGKCMEMEQAIVGIRDKYGL